MTTTLAHFSSPPLHCCCSLSTLSLRHFHHIVTSGSSGPSSASSKHHHRATDFHRPPARRTLRPFTVPHRPPASTTDIRSTISSTSHHRIIATTTIPAYQHQFQPSALPVNRLRSHRQQLATDIVSLVIIQSADIDTTNIDFTTWLSILGQHHRNTIITTVINRLSLTWHHFTHSLTSPPHHQASTNSLHCYQPLQFRRRLHRRHQLSAPRVIAHNPPQRRTNRPTISHSTTNRPSTAPTLASHSRNSQQFVSICLMAFPLIITTTIHQGPLHHRIVTVTTTWHHHHHHHHHRHHPATTGHHTGTGPHRHAWSFTVIRRHSCISGPSRQHQVITGSGIGRSARRPIYSAVGNR